MNPNTQNDCVTEWLGRIKAGDPEAARRLWEGYFTKLVGLARGKLRAASRAAADEEDVALSAFDSFCRGAGKGRFPQLDDRDDLWQVLFMITSRKAAGLARREMRQKRGGGKVVQVSALAADSAGDDAYVGAADASPTPEFAALVSEECRSLLDSLEDATLREIAVWKMEGYTNAEIADKIGRVEGTVERKLALIRQSWKREVDQ